MSTPPITFPMRPRPGADFCASSIRIDARFSAEPKINGIRFVANLETKEAWNRHNQPLTDAAAFLPALTALADIFLPLGIVWVDCESWGRYEGQTRMLFVIDVIFPASDALAGRTYLERRAALEAVLPVWDGLTFPTVTLMPSGESIKMWNWMLELRKVPGNEKLVEGIVLKRNDSLYDTQRVSPTRESMKWVKFRFDQSICQPMVPPHDRQVDDAPQYPICHGKASSPDDQQVDAPRWYEGPSWLGGNAPEVIQQGKLTSNGIITPAPEVAPVLQHPVPLAKLGPRMEARVGSVVWFVEAGVRVVGAPIEAVSIEADKVEVRVLGTWRDFSTVSATAALATLTSNRAADPVEASLPDRHSNGLRWEELAEQIATVWWRCHAIGATLQHNSVLRDAKTFTVVCEQSPINVKCFHAETPLEAWREAETWLTGAGATILVALNQPDLKKTATPL